MKDADFFAAYAKSIRAAIHTFAPARVISFDAARKTADVKPLFKIKKRGGVSVEYPVLQQCPVVAHVESDIKSGSVVFLAFAERSLDNLSGSRTFDPDSYRMHDISDAVVIGVWNG